jgi:nicotinamidase-related amidase
MAVWDRFLTDRDKRVFEKAGFGVRIGFGERPAVLVVDVNYDFVGHEPAPVLESIELWHQSCGEDGWRGMAAIARVLAAAREKSLPVFYTTVAKGREDGLGHGLWPNSRKNEPSAVEGYEGNEIPDAIAPEPRDVVIHKAKPSAFFGTPLVSYLTELGVDSLLVCGATTSGCVRASVVDASSYGFKVSVVEEGTFDRGEASHAISLFDMNAKYADVVSLQGALDHIGKLPVDVFEHKPASSLFNERHPGGKCDVG